MATTVLLYSEEQSSMVDTWTDRVYLTLRKDGSISVKGEVYGEDPNTGRYRTYHMGESETRIRTPERLLEVLGSIEDIGRYEYDDVKLITALEELDPKWAFAMLKVLYDQLKAAADPGTNDARRVLPR